MLRKIIQLGKETLVVSLPSAWARQHGLKKGDELEAEEQGPRLILYPKSEAKASRAVVDVSKTLPVTKRILGALYKAGYEEIELRFESPAELEVIQNTIRESFVGFEIITKTKQAVVAKNISQPKHEEFDSLIRKVFLLLLEMGEGCYKSVTSGDMADLISLASLDNDINRHINFCRRTLNTVGHKVAGRVAPIYHLVEQLERTGDSYRELCKFLSKSGVVLKSSQKELLADTNAFTRLFYNLYYKFSLRDIAEFWKEKEKLEKNVAETLDGAGRMEAYSVVLISEIIESIAGANGALLTAKL